MARAYGSSAHLLMKRETVCGQAATGNYIRMPFNRCDLGSEQGLIDDPVLGQRRDPLAPLQDVITDDGDVIVPVDLEFAYTLSAQAKLVLTAHEVYLPKPKLSSWLLKARAACRRAWISAGRRRPPRAACGR
jgi:hypothetical protein